METSSQQVNSEQMEINIWFVLVFPAGIDIADIGIFSIDIGDIGIFSIDIADIGISNVGQF